VAYQEIEVPHGPDERDFRYVPTSHGELQLYVKKCLKVNPSSFLIGFDTINFGAQHREIVFCLTYKSNLSYTHTPKRGDLNVTLKGSKALIVISPQSHRGRREMIVYFAFR
jgi:hypothetical protein